MTVGPITGSLSGSATINWGDGTSSMSNSGTLIGTHTYAEEGAYTGAVTYTDDCGTHTNVPFHVKVADASLSASGRTVNATIGVSFNSSVATFSDANPGGAVPDYSATINWGDGGTSAGSISTGSGGFVVSGSH